MPFEYQTKFSLVFRPPFEYRTGIWMVDWIPNYHLNTGQVKVCYSDVFVIQMFVIQIPTVFRSPLNVWPSLTCKNNFLGTNTRASPRRKKRRASGLEDEVESSGPGDEVKASELEDEEKETSPRISPTKNLDSKANHDISGKATVTIWIPDKSGFQIVQMCPVFELWSENRTKNVCFMVKNVGFWNGLSNHVIRPFENFWWNEVEVSTSKTD